MCQEMSENLVEDQIAEATMLCTLCQGLRLTELVALEIECDEESETCRLMNTARAYHHQPSFEALCLSSGNGCILCQLMSQVLEKDQDWSDDDKLYGSKNGESDDDLVLQLRTACSTQIYVYSVDGSDRQDDAGIFEIAVVSTFSSQRKTSSSSPANPDAFFWRALEVWPENGEFLP